MGRATPRQKGKPKTKGQGCPTLVSTAQSSRPVVWTTLHEGILEGSLDTWKDRTIGQDTA